MGPWDKRSLQQLQIDFSEEGDSPLTSSRERDKRESLKRHESYAAERSGKQSPLF